MKSCLVVDDSKVVRLVAGKIIKNLAFEFAEAAGGDEALQKCGKRMPDAVLLDGNMADMDSVDFLRRMRKLPGGDRPVVLFCLSGNDGVEAGDDPCIVGADEFVRKPFDGEAIQSKFHQAGLL